MKLTVDYEGLRPRPYYLTRNSEDKWDVNEQSSNQTKIVRKGDKITYLSADGTESSFVIGEMKRKIHDESIPFELNICGDFANPTAIFEGVSIGDNPVLTRGGMNMVNAAADISEFRTLERLGSVDCTVNDDKNNTISFHEMEWEFHPPGTLFATRTLMKLRLSMDIEGIHTLDDLLNKCEDANDLKSATVLNDIKFLSSCYKV